MPEQHAKLSASGAHRWLHCTPSALLEHELPDTSSEAAEQGTAAHALAEHKLRKALGLKTRKPRSKWHDTEMDELTDEYAEYVLTELKKSQQKCPDAEALIEQRLDFSDWVPGGFGTGDCVIIAEPTLHIIDLKYGQGVLVNAENNPQMKLYALGALATFDVLYDIEEVTCTVYQPRRENISSWTIPVAELKEWADGELKDLAELASKGEGEFDAGEWCLFCKLGPTCRARAEQNLELVKMDFADPAELSDEEIAQVLGQIAELKRWANSIESYALETALSGEKSWPGFKLVEGRSIRKYTDPEAVSEALLGAGYTESDVFEKKLRGITAVEKLTGKKQFNELLGELVEKPAGKPALVPETDKRPALVLDNVADDFDDEN